MYFCTVKNTLMFWLEYLGASAGILRCFYGRTEMLRVSNVVFKAKMYGMKKYGLRLFVGLWMLCVCCLSQAQQSRDSIQFSLVTCAPGSEIYALFGHTAIRYQNFSRGEDVMFNYGMFSFSAPHFVYRFVKGETDYCLGLTPTRYFEAEYAMRGSSVWQQVLNLREDEKFRLLALLEENYRPENRVYRYNYFYDNCTTRARDQIEKCIAGKVVYPDGVPGKTFRSVVHEFTAGSPWDEMGIDFCLGAEADRPIPARSQMFAPFYMKAFASRAYIEDENGNRRPLVLREEKIVDVDAEPAPASAFTPMMAAVAFLMLNVLVGWWQWKRRRIFWGWDILLYACQGIAGCVIAFLFFVSSHPTVGSNWLLILFNPIPLFYLPVMVFRTIKQRKDGYHLANMVYLTLFIALFLLLPQKFNLTVLPLALGLLVNAVSHVLVLKHKE